MIQGPKQLRTARLTLRPLSRGTAGDIVAGRHRSDWASDFPQDGDRTVARVLLAGGPAFADPRWGAYEVWTGTGVCIGTAGFFGPPVDGEVEVGYGIVPGHRGRGLATEAVGALVAQARKHGVRRVVARVAADNAASLSVLRRTGFAVVGDRESEELRLVLDVNEVDSSG